MLHDPITVRDILKGIDCQIALLEEELKVFKDTPSFHEMGHRGGIASLRYLKNWTVRQLECKEMFPFS